MPDAPGLELILAEINRTEPGAVIDTSFDREQASLIVDPRHIIGVLTWLKDTPGQEYTFLSSVHGVDYLPAEPRFAVIYELLNRERYERLRIKALLTDPAVEVADTGVTVSAGTTAASATPASTTGTAPGSEAGSGEAPIETVSESEAAVGEGPTGTRGDSRPGGPSPSGATNAPAPALSPEGKPMPRIDSCVPLFPTADFQEREVFDFFGIQFDGHPDMRRILMPEDYVGWPQRRDFPVGGEPVIFTKDEVTNPGWWQ